MNSRGLKCCYFRREQALTWNALFLPELAGLEGVGVPFSGRDKIRAAIDGGLPCLGICLGMQLLFDSSEEGNGRGLGAIPGTVRKLRAERVPQMGWNDLEDVRDSALRSGKSQFCVFREQLRMRA